MAKVARGDGAERGSAGVVMATGVGMAALGVS